MSAVMTHDDSALAPKAARNGGPDVENNDAKKRGINAGWVIFILVGLLILGEIVFFSIAFSQPNDYIPDEVRASETDAVRP